MDKSTVAKKRSTSGIHKQRHERHFAGGHRPESSIEVKTGVPGSVEKERRGRHLEAGNENAAVEELTGWTVSKEYKIK